MNNEEFERLVFTLTKKVVGSGALENMPGWDAVETIVRIAAADTVLITDGTLKIEDYTS